MMFLSGRYFDADVPKEKRYLLHYFATEIQAAFLRYYFVFGDISNFTDHTGYYVTQKWVYKLRVRLERLEKIRDKAKSNMDLTLLAEIESGNFKEGHQSSRWFKIEKPQGRGEIQAAPSKDTSRSG